MKVLKDPSLIKGYMARVNITNHALTKITGINKDTIKKRLEDGDWKIHELIKLKILLNISDEEMGELLVGDEKFIEQETNKMEDRIEERARLLQIGKAIMRENGKKIYKKNLKYCRDK